MKAVPLNRQRLVAIVAHRYGLAARSELSTAPASYSLPVTSYRLPPTS